ncbi:MAG TPA: response regulator [Bacteroidia bacterium]|nr:response regulator [Bacteroidia bacterium]
MMKVLIVEDDFMLCLINKKSIELIGYKVVATATNGIDAIEAVKKHNPDVVLMDLRLDGELDGIDTMHEISKFSEVPAIYLTGNSDEINKERAAKTNTLGFCVKPVHFEELKALFANVKLRD